MGITTEKELVRLECKIVSQGSFVCGSAWQQVQTIPHTGLPAKRGRRQATPLFSPETTLDNA
eukprot:1475619-Lingulodinium_polyedra.AAC.1